MEENDQALEGIGTSLGNAQSLTLLQDAAKRRQEREHTLFLDVPSWNGDLIAEYRVVPPNELRALADTAVRRARNNGDSRGVDNDISMIVASCVGLYMKNPETGERVPVEDEFGHVKYDRIAKLLGKDDEIKSNADAVRYLTAERDDEGGWVENIMAISVHANAIARWTRDPSKRNVELEDILGEL